MNTAEGEGLRKVCKKSGFPTSFDLSNIFKRILWM